MNPHIVDQALKRYADESVAVHECRIQGMAKQPRQSNALDPDPMCGEIAKLREELAMVRERVAVLEANAGKSTQVLTIRQTPPLTPPYVVTAIDTGEEHW